MADEDDELRDALRVAREELQLQESFLAVVAHELRNPLGPVMMSVDAMLLEMRNSELDRDTLVHRLVQMRRYVDRLRTDLDRLLDFSRARSGRIDIQLANVDLCDTVARAVSELEPQFGIAGCQVNLALERPQVGQWDPMRLDQVVWNLLSNAIKYAPAAPIDISVTGNERSSTLCVRDHGPGIAPEERERVFRRFERAGSAKQHTGFGIGLWLVRRIVDAHGGSITLDSELDVGTTFTVMLPR